MILTNTAIHALQPGQSIKDDAVDGLHVRAYPRYKSFFLYYRTKAGKERRPKLGEVGILTLAQARDIARGMLADVAQGRDPVAEHRQARHAPTMDELWTRCEREQWNHGRPWDREAKRLYHRHVAAQVGACKVADVRYADVDAIRTSLAATPNQANRVIAVLSKMLNLAERWEWRAIGSNPCQRAPRYPEAARRRYATPEEIAKLGRALDAEAAAHPAAVAFLYLCLFSGARPSEIVRAAWSQLERREDGSGVLRLPDGKTGQRTVFLSVPAMQALRRLPETTGTITGLAGVPKGVWNRVRRGAGCQDLWARDFRTTFATIGFSSGQSLGIVGDLLGHKTTQTTKKHYAMLMEEPALQAAGRISATIEQMLRGSEAVAPK